MPPEPVRMPSGRCFRARRAGFSLLELVVALAIVALLAATAVNVYRTQALKARRVEAYEILSGIYKAQTAYRAQHGHYADSFDTLAFEASGAARVDERTLQGRHYTFTVEAFDVDGVTAANFRAFATADLDPSDPLLDILTIENDLTLVE